MSTSVEHRPRLAKQIVADYLTEIEIPATADDVYVVWFCKTLQNWKALLSTDLVDTGIYFEVTYNGDKNEAYLDHYQKMLNRRIGL